MLALINGVHLGHESRGTVGPVLVLLHAFPLNRAMWEPQMTDLCVDFRTVALDFRGFGESDAPDGPYSMEMLADDVKGLLDHLAVERVVLCGLSMGGYVALAFYRKYRELVQALVLADTRAGADPPEVRQGRYQMMEIARREGPPAVAERMLPRLLAPITFERDPALVERVRKMMEAAPTTGLVGALAGMAERPDSTGLLPQIACPTLVVVGEHDAPAPPAEARTMAEAIPRARLEVIPEAGHLSNLEQPETFNQFLRDWLYDEVVGP